MEHADLAAIELDQSVLLGLLVRATGTGKARPVRSEVVLVDGAGDAQGAGVEAEVGAHDGDAVVAVAGEVAKGGVDTAKEARFYQRQLDLF